MDNPTTAPDLARRPANQDFFLGDMGAIYDAADGQADVPHRHDYYTVLLVAAARGEHRIDYRTFSFRERQVYFVSPGQVHQVALRERPRGWVFTFSRAFLVENNIPESFISNINLFRPFGESPPLVLNDDSFARLRNLVREMEVCWPQTFTYRNRALGALLQLFLIYCSNSVTLDSTQLDEENPGVCLLRDFKQLVERRYTDWHQVQDYAAQVHVTPKHLSHTVKSLTGKSAKEVIQDRLTLEAQRLLLHTDLSIKEIAYRTGFGEPLHFSSFFKKQAGLSPSAFRQTHRS